MVVQRIYKSLKALAGPLIFVKTVEGISFGELVEVTVKRKIQLAVVLEITREFTVLQLYGHTAGLDLESTSVKFLQKNFEIGLSLQMLGRVFNGLGQPIDGLRNPTEEVSREINGLSLNPVCRYYPQDFIQTGISSIDVMNTLVRGQKLPIFSAAGLPHNQLAAQITAQAESRSGNSFAVVFAAMGIRHDDAAYFINHFKETGVLKTTTLFLNYADDPAIERLVTPRIALTVAEFLAFDKGMDVLVILTDMTAYAEALREVAAARGEIPSRKGFPGYMYSDLSSIYERAGRVKDRQGSVTQIPILTMPGEDITHPVPDLTGYITEGQIVLDRTLYGQRISPPINLIPSLSRLMKDSIGKGLTREDHPKLFMQLYASYAKSLELRSIAAILSEDEMSDIDRLYLKFGREFENVFVNQGFKTNRTLEQSLNLAWEILSILPKRELTNISTKEIIRYYKGDLEA